MRVWYDESGHPDRSIFSHQGAHLRAGMPRGSRELYAHLRAGMPRGSRELYAHLRAGMLRGCRELYAHLRAGMPRGSRDSNVVAYQLFVILKESIIFVFGL